MNYPEEAYDFDPLRRIGAEVVSLDDEGLRVRLDEPDLPAEMRVIVHRAGVNVEFDETLRLVEPGSRLNLVDVTVVDDALLPHYLVLEPDYLVDVSALAECVQEYGAGWQRYFWNRMRPKAVTDSILLGNSVNLMFDELVTADDCRAVTFESLMPKLFARYPIEFAATSSKVWHERLMRPRKPGGISAFRLFRCTPPIAGYSFQSSKWSCSAIAG